MLKNFKKSHKKMSEDFDKAVKRHADYSCKNKNEMVIQKTNFNIQNKRVEDKLNKFTPFHNK